MAANDTDLLPCPFCGGPAILDDEWAVCEHCGAQGAAADPDHPQSAAEAWNLRTPAPAAMGREAVETLPADAGGLTAAWRALEKWLGTWADSIPAQAYHQLCTMQLEMLAAAAPRLASEPSAKLFAEDDAVCEAIYDAVSRANLTRDVKSPERKCAVVRAALNISEAGDAD